ncbi:MAG: ABC transporter substrate-binding protein [Chloroflexia bacterium]|nr:ABC transporter substrate-binding protein [Chloroflexia bacterium]MDQ3512065.1 ABC transporter substrate-binding protein [Chloroflexota bacterium]
MQNEIQKRDNERIKMARLFGKMSRGEITRREMLQQGAAAGIGAATLALFANGPRRAWAQDATPAAGVEVGSTVPVPTDLRTDLTGQEITAILGNDGPGVPFEEAMIAKFSEATGIVVERISGPTATDERLTQYLQSFSAESADIDVVMIDVIDAGVVAAHAIDLTDVLASQGVEYIERIVQNNTVDGKLVGIPWYTDAGLLYYRTDLLEKYGFEAPPATWDELQSMAQTIQEGERATTPDFQGFVFQGASYEGLTCNALEWVASNGGGEIVDADGTVTLNNEKAVAILGQAAGWVNTISPEGVTTYKEEDGRGVWQVGNAAFMRNWPYAYSLGQNPDAATGEVPVIADKFDVVVLPAGTGEGARNADTLGGWQMMVSTYSEAQDAAKEFAKFMTSPAVQKGYAIELSLLPTIPDLYSDADVLAANPFYERLLDVFQNGAVARPSTPSSVLYPELSSIFYQGVNGILTGADAASTVEEMAADMETLLSEL